MKKKTRDFGGVPSRAWRAGSRQKQGSLLRGRVVVKSQRSARKNPLRPARMKTCPGRCLPGPLKPVSRWCLARSFGYCCCCRRCCCKPTKNIQCRVHSRVRAENRETDKPQRIYLVQGLSSTTLGCLFLFCFGARADSTKAPRGSVLFLCLSKEK